MRRSLQPVVRWIFCAILSALVTVPCLAEDLKSIHPTGYVTDLAHVLSADERAQLEAYCGLLHQKTGAQMAIVTVNSLHGMSSSTYAHELFNTLGVGDRTRNDGVLILIAPKEHKYWTSVGYGLESVITKEIATEAGKEMTPYFRRGEFGGGIEAAARQLGSYIARNQGVDLEESAAVATVAQVPRQAADDSMVWTALITVVVFAAAILLLVLIVRWMIANAGSSMDSGGYQRPGILSQPRSTWWNNQTYYGGDSSTWGGFGGSSGGSTFTGGDSGFGGGGDSGFSGFDGGSSSGDSGGGGSW